jgi:glycosyltransferase involved in cell wall biosynthesis
VSEKSVLIITYYWPPSGGSGVQRWLKFAKYLPKYGYTPYIFTPENPSFDLRDESLLQDVPAEAEVIHFPIWEPYKLFHNVSRAVGDQKERTTNLVSTKRKSVFQRVSTWIRGNFIIPDPRVFWVRPSVSFLTDFIRDKNIRTIITTGPPHSVHLIGLGLKKRNSSLKWVADFRDPWSTWGLLDSLSVGSTARKIHRYLEKRVLAKADKIITITPFYVRKFAELSGRHVELLTNGYDEEDFTSLELLRPKQFIIRHIGIVNEKCNPRPFMVALKELMSHNADFAADVRVNFIGDVHPDFKSFVAADAVLSSITTFTPPVSHKELKQYYASAAVLLLILTGYKDAEGYMPGKLFEYFATGLPVLGVGPVNGDAAEIIRESGGGTMIDTQGKEEMKAWLSNEFNSWKNNVQRRRSASRRAFSREVITGKLAELLNGLR